VKEAGRVPLLQRAFDELRAYLCLRRPDDDAAAWENASETASRLDQELHGATHRSWPSHRQQPLPYLPESVLPPRHRTGARFASATCAAVVQQTLERRPFP
jgi:hypothetical protein